MHLDGGWIEQVVLGEPNMVKLIKIPLGRFLNSHIYQGLFKLHGNDPAASMDLLFFTMKLSHIMDGYTKLMCLCFRE